MWGGVAFALKNKSGIFEVLVAFVWLRYLTLCNFHGTDSDRFQRNPCELTRVMPEWLFGEQKQQRFPQIFVVFAAGLGSLSKSKGANSHLYFCLFHPLSIWQHLVQKRFVMIRDDTRFCDWHLRILHQPNPHPRISSDEVDTTSIVHICTKRVQSMSFHNVNRTIQT